jgi:hypothetical protein
MNVRGIREMILWAVFLWLIILGSLYFLVGCSPVFVFCMPVIGGTVAQCEQLPPPGTH